LYKHKPTEIIVDTMTGETHILFTQYDGEKFSDIKTALLPYVVGGPSLHRLSLSLKREDGSFDIDVDDGRLIPVPLNDGVVNLKLLIKDITMNAEQQALIDKWTRDTGKQLYGGDYLTIEADDVNTPDKMEALLFYLENNTLEELTVTDVVNIHQIISIILNNNIPIEDLAFKGKYHPGDGLSPDEMREVFEMVGQINTLRVFSISCDSIGYDDFDGVNRDRSRVSYRLNDLADLLEHPTSLTRINIRGCNIILDENDVGRLAYVLQINQQLDELQLVRNKYSLNTVENTRDFIESFQHIIPPKRDGDNVNDNYEIDLVWTKSGEFNSFLYRS
jgi:hypothetical protein